MNKLYNTLVSLTIASVLWSCEQPLSVYDTPDCWINFEYLNQRNEVVKGEVTQEQRTSTSAFVYKKPDVMLDTLWFKVTTVGFVSDQDRPFVIQQIQDTISNAISGTHFIPIDDAETVRKYYYIPAGEISTKIPVFLKRDPSLADHDVQFTIGLKENEYFKNGFEGYDTRIIRVSNLLSQPSFWQYIANYFGKYGRVKHQFLIDTTGGKWDNNYIRPMANETAYAQYMAHKMREELEVVNAGRIAKGLDVLKEADGTVVTIAPV